MFMTKVCLKSNLRDELVQLKSLTRIAVIVHPMWHIQGQSWSLIISRDGNEYPVKCPIIEYQNRYSVTRKTFFYEIIINDKIFRTINN